MSLSELASAIPYYTIANRDIIRQFYWVVATNAYAATLVGYIYEASISSRLLDGNLMMVVLSGEIFTISFESFLPSP